MKHLREISRFDRAELRQVGKTKCLVRLNDEYVTVDCSTILNRQIVLIRVREVGQQLFWNKNI